MCDVVSRVAGDPSVPEASRRAFLKVLGVTAAAGGVVAAGMGTARAEGAPSSGRGVSGRTRLVLLGTAGGPTLTQSQRSGVSTAVAYGDRVYVVDLGLGAMLRLRQSSLTPQDSTASTFTRVRGIFFTHLHSDHVTDWPAVYATGAMNATGRPAGTPIEVWGPGDRGSLPPFRGRPGTEPAVYNPAQPTPGTAAMTAYLTQAWAADFNDRARDSGFPGPQSLFAVHDVPAPVPTPPSGVPPRISPFPVWQDGEVTVTATLVDHRPTAPAFGFRFDTPDGSIVVSGDTGVSENLVELAQGADYLVHEVIDPDWIDRLVATLPATIGEPLRAHLLESHTAIDRVGRDVAEPAGVRNLVLTHLVPAENPEGRWRQAARGYSGRLVVGRDLLELAVG